MTRHTLTQLAAAAWIASLLWLLVGGQTLGVHRELLAVAITFTVLAYVDRRTNDCETFLRLGLRAGAASRRSRELG